MQWNYCMYFAYVLSCIHTENINILPCFLYLPKPNETIFAVAAATYCIAVAQATVLVTVARATARPAGAQATDCNTVRYTVTSAHMKTKPGALVDRGANGGLVGSDIHTITKSDKKLDIL